MTKKFRRFFQAMLMIGISLSIGGLANAQCPPQGKVAVIMVNGILGEGVDDWGAKVESMGINFRNDHTPKLSADCVEFVPVFNTSAWAFSDINQSLAHLMQLAVTKINLIDLDMLKLLRVIESYAKDGHKVILVGHSQGTLYTNIAYEFIRGGSSRIIVPSITSLPDNGKLEIVNIATPSNKVSDGNGHYTTQCGDAILAWLSGLRANINGGSSACAGQLPSTHKHSLETYMTPGSETQKQIYADLDLALRLPDSGCGGVAGCQLKDNFSDSSYVTNFMANPYDSGTLKEGSGALWLSAKRFLASGSHGGGIYVAGKVSARTRRVFSGIFNASFRWNFIPTGNPVAKVNFVRTSDNASRFEVDLSQGGWNNLEFRRTSTRVTVLRNGSEIDNFSSRSSDEYYLKFEVQSDANTAIDSTLLIDDLLVAMPAPTLIATCSADPAVITAGQSATFTGSSSGGTGVRRGSWSGVVSGSGSTATYRTSTSTPPGFGKATYTVTDSGSPKQTTTTTCQVQIKAAVAKGTIIITTNGTVPSVSCKINGTSVNAPGVFRSQSVGSKTLSCTPPNGFTLTSITPSATQTLTAGGEISFKVNLASVQSAPVLNRISVNTEPRVNTRIGVTLGGTGITPPGVDAYYCTSSSTSTCKKVTSFYIYESDSITFSFTPSTTGRFYLRVKKNGAWSNYRTMVVIK